MLVLECGIVVLKISYAGKRRINMCVILARAVPIDESQVRHSGRDLQLLDRLPSDTQIQRSSVARRLSQVAPVLIVHNLTPVAPTTVLAVHQLVIVVLHRHIVSLRQQVIVDRAGGHHIQVTLQLPLVQRSVYPQVVGIDAGVQLS